MKRRTLHPAAQEPLGMLLARELERTDADAAELVRAGAVYVRGRRCVNPTQVVGPGTPVMVVLEEGGREALAPMAKKEALRILFEDRDLIAVAKPAGITSQPTPSRKGESLADLVRDHIVKDAGLVHRLDRETSGVIVFGKTKEATSGLALQFRKGTASKRYLAVASGRLDEAGVIDLPISGDPARPGRFRASATANGQKAVTVFQRLFAAPDHSLVALFPKTGRTHQLRAHLTALGAPIVGDARYGGPESAAGITATRCLLHAQALRIDHPLQRKPMLFEAPLPEDLAAVFAKDGVKPPEGAWSDPTEGMRR